MSQKINEKSSCVVNAISIKEFVDAYASLPVVNKVRMVPNIIAKYGLMKEIANLLVKDYDFMFHDIIFHDEFYEGYCGEFILISDENKDIWIEPLLRKDIYLNPIDPTFIHGDCNSKILVEHPEVLFIPFEISDNS